MFENILTPDNLKILNEVYSGDFEGQMTEMWQRHIDSIVRDYKISQIEITEQDKADVVAVITNKREGIMNEAVTKETELPA